MNSSHECRIIQYRCGTCKVRQFPKLAHPCWGKTWGSSPIPRSGGYNDPRDRTDRGCFGRKTEVARSWSLVCINGAALFDSSSTGQRYNTGDAFVRVAPLFESSVLQFPLSSPPQYSSCQIMESFPPRQFSSIRNKGATINFDILSINQFCMRSFFLKRIATKNLSLFEFAVIMATV